MFKYDKLDSRADLKAQSNPVLLSDMNESVWVPTMSDLVMVAGGDDTNPVERESTASSSVRGY